MVRDLRTCVRHTRVPVNNLKSKPRSFRVIWGFYRDHGKANGTYHAGLRSLGTNVALHVPPHTL